MANGLPSVEVPQPVLGQSVSPLGRLAEFDIPAEETTAIAMPDIGATPALLPLEFDVPLEPADGAVAKFDVPELGDSLAEPPPIEFEAEPISPRAQLAAGISPEFEEQQFTVASLSAEEDALRKRGQELAFQLGSEKDPIKRAEAEQQAEDNIAASQANQQQLGLARGMRDRTQAVETARLGDALASRERQVLLDVEASRLAAEREQAIDDADQLRQQQAAQSDVSAARERHAQIIVRGPKRAAFVNTAIAMITEALKPVARPDGTADYGAAVDRLVRETKEQHAREVEAARLRSEVAGDEVGNIARARKEGALQSAVIRELTARSLRLEVEKQAAATQDEFARARALTIADDLKRQESAAQAVQRELAEDKARKSAMDDAKRRKLEAEIALTGAKIGTEGQRAQKLAAEAAKAARRGGGARAKVDTSSLFGRQIGDAVNAGRLDEKGAKLVFQQGVIDPVSGELTTRKDGSFALATSPKIAAELNASGARVARVNSLVNEAVAIRGAKGWEPTGKFLGTEAGQRMQAISTELLLVAKNVWALGALTEADENLLGRINGGDLAGMKDPRPVLEDMRRRMIAAYNQERKSKAPGSQALGFGRVTTAPKRTLADVDTLLNQSPNLRSGDVVDVSAKLAAADEKFELLVEANNGDIRAASEQFTRDTAETIKRANADRGELVDAFLDATPDNWNELTRAAARAAFERQALPESATGAQINAAERKEKRALRAAENALSPRAKRLRSGMENQRDFVDELKRKAGGELARQAKSRKLDEERKVAREREIRLSELPTAGKI